MENLIQRIQRTRDIVFNNGDLACMAICHCIEDYAKICWQNNWKWEQKALNSAGSLLYNFPVYTTNQIYPDSIRYGVVILLDRVIDNLTDRS
jgi:hypothetical protein